VNNREQLFVHVYGQELNLPFSYLYLNNEIKHHVYLNRGRTEIKEDDTLKLENIRKFYNKDPK